MTYKDFAPRSHFFTDPAALTQVEGQAFGPVSEHEYRLTTQFTVPDAGARAFAVCTGVVLIQPQAGSSTKVNLILRPFKQPVQGLNIRYFIYRGLQLSDFFEVKIDANNNDITTVKLHSTETSDFINRINEVFNDFYALPQPGQPAPVLSGSPEPAPPFLAKFIGFDPASQQDTTLLLDDFFFKRSNYVQSNGQFTEAENTSFELPMIEAGKSIGNFVGINCGIDIVLNYGDYKQPSANDGFVFDLAYARADTATINLTGEKDGYKRQLRKEQIYQFLDAAAYYGLHCGVEKGIVIIDNGGGKVPRKRNDIYTDIVSRFFTKNRWYLYIQGDRTRSYNFYSNYYIKDNADTSLKTGATETSLVERSFETLGWPLLIDEAPQTHTLSRNKLFLQLVTDNNVNSMFYGQIAHIDNAQKSNFIDVANLLLPPGTDGILSRFTKVIALSNPAIVTDDNKRLNVACFSILLYQGMRYTYVAAQTKDDKGATLDVLAQPDFFDDVFDNINATPLLAAGDDPDYSIITLQKLKLINQFYDKRQQGVSAVQTAIITDVIDTGITATPTQKRVTYITESVEISSNAIGISRKITFDTKSAPAVSGSVTGNKTYRLPEPFYFEMKEFTDSTQTISGLLLKSYDNTTPNKIILGLTKIENELLKGLISTHRLFNARLFLVNLFEDGNQLISMESTLYQKYRVGVVGEQASGKLTLYHTSPEVLVYSLDRKYHFSKGYSDNMKEIHDENSVENIYTL